MPTIHRIRVQAKTEEAFRTIFIALPSGNVRCSCWPEPDFFCAHVDAVLVAGERHMVHPDDRALADIVQQSIAPLNIPADWKGSWRRNKRWRGLPVTDRAKPRSKRELLPAEIDIEEYERRPAVVFTGALPVSRGEASSHAMAHGWQAVATVRSDVMYLVTGSENASPRKIKMAEARGLPVLNYDQWLEILSHPIDLES